MTRFEAPDEWWRGLVEGLDDRQLKKLLDGKLTMHVLRDGAYDQAQLEVPEDLRVEFAYRLS